jgi:superfamily I DNA/RNA helicase
MSAAAAYLESLNPQQRRAVEHGVADLSCATAGPLLVIAGAGSGKTNTLAHRVAHLIASGADPQRILLMTFSRRAAAEMAKRVERISRKAMGDKAGIMTDALTWAGTFHGIGARLLREYAEQIGLNPAFTIHDREDSADLMNLARHDLGLSKTESRFITLDRNYRSTQNILAAANGVIGLAAERFTKNLWTDRTSGTKPQLVSVRDEADQARFIVERVLENREAGTLLKQQAVLFRASSHSGPP